MTVLTANEIFEKAIKIMHSKNQITIHFSKNAVLIRFPTTRSLAEELQTPHYYVLPYFAMMEKDGLITREERVGISTTIKGSKKMIELMSSAKYKKKTEEIIGATLLKEIQKQIMMEED